MRVVKEEYILLLYLYASYKTVSIKVRYEVRKGYEEEQHLVMLDGADQSEY